MEFLDFLKEYGGYVALPVVINALMEGGKKGFKKFFLHSWGVRLACFLPIILGALGGLLLPFGNMQESLLMGAALGALSHYIYKFVSVTLASDIKLKYITMKKEEARVEYKSLKGKADNEVVAQESTDESSVVDQ
jgi:hypothetical protein